MRNLLPITILQAALTTAFAAAETTYPFEKADRLRPGNKIDEFVFDRLRRMKIEPAALCSDEVFLRRAYLDVIGTLPTYKEAKNFLQDQSPDKREELIDTLLERDEYADYWSMRWADILRVKAEFPVNLWPNAVQAYHRWIHTSLRENKPYDRFARELLTASGSNFREAPVNFYRSMQNTEPETLAKGVALTFMGVRAENWPDEKLTGMAAFFAYVGFKKTAEWKEQVVFHNPWSPAVTNTPTGKPRPAVFPDGARARLNPAKDPRADFAGWLISPKNPYFTKHAVNRLWYWVMGRGIVHEPDDVRPDNPPANPELLDWLAKQFVISEYDQKYILKLILNSTTYRLSSIPRSKHPKAAANFAGYPVRRLEAEVLVDALCQLTGTTEKYSSQIPEPFTYIPEQQRSILLADGSITSPFLEMFGRPPRDTGLLSERNNKPSAAQRLHFLISSHVRNKFTRSKKLRELLYSSQKRPREAMNKIYLTFLSRLPTDEERGMISQYADSSGMAGRDLALDLMWTLVNSKEFMYRH